MEILYLLLALVWSILCLILFFKVWGMTNDVRDIRDHLLHSQVLEQNIASPEPQDFSELTPGTKVIHKDLNKVLIIDSLNNNGKAALCKDENGKIVATYHLNNLKKL